MALPIEYRPSAAGLRRGHQDRSKRWDIFSNRGIGWASAGDMRRAFEDFDQAIRLSPNDADVYYNRGLARHRDNNLEGAIADYSHAIELDPNHSDASHNRRKARLKGGDQI